MSDPVRAGAVTADELATHLVCPRQFEFRHRRQVARRPSSRQAVRDSRRDLLREAIFAGFSADDATASERADAAVARLDARWDDYQHEPYLSDVQGQYDRDSVRAGLRAYFEGQGSDHAESLVDVDTTLTDEQEEIRFEVDVDAIVRDGAQYVAVRYVPNFNGIMWRYGYEPVQRYRDGEQFYPRQVGSLATAALAIRGLRNRFETLDLAFRYVAVLGETQPGEDGPTVDVQARDLAPLYLNDNDERDAMNRLLVDRAERILDDDTDPTARFADIKDTACEYCPYQDTCPDYIRSEVQFNEWP